MRILEDMDHQMTQRVADQTRANKSSVSLSSLRSLWAGAVLGMGSLVIAAPAFAHHPLGGKLPNTWLEGFLSGIGHPVLGPDHLAFVIALGLLTAAFNQSLKASTWVPVSFAVMTLLGVGIHLQAFSLPATEAIVASTVIVMGAFLAFSQRLQALAIVGFGAISGVFHGYAYGEAIVGAEPSPLLAYLIGLILIQLTISGMAFGIGKVAQSLFSQTSIKLFRYAGLMLSVFGIVLLGNTFGA